MTARREPPPALILAGGRGTRLGRRCAACPKPLLPVAGQPFLQYLVDALVQQGVRRFNFLTGYRGDAIAAYLRRHQPAGCEYAFTQEPQPRGTGGAVRAAVETMAPDARFLVLNGDSFIPFAVGDLVAAARGGDGALVAAEVGDGRRFGNLTLDGAGWLRGFAEKNAPARAALVNAGVYYLAAELFFRFPRGQPLSIETDCFPRWLAAGVKLAVLNAGRELLDIGTPASLRQATKRMRQFQQQGQR